MPEGARESCQHALDFANSGFKIHELLRRNDAQVP